MPAGKGYGPKANAIAGVGKRGGAARDAGKKVEKRKSRNASALDFARKMTMRQGTDSANPRPKR